MNKYVWVKSGLDSITDIDRVSLQRRRWPRRTHTDGLSLTSLSHRLRPIKFRVDGMPDVWPRLHFYKYCREHYQNLLLTAWILPWGFLNHLSSKKLRKPVLADGGVTPLYLPLIAALTSFTMLPASSVVLLRVAEYRLPNTRDGSTPIPSPTTEIPDFRSTSITS